MDPVLANLTKLPGMIAVGIFASNDSCSGFATLEDGYEPLIVLTSIRVAEDALDVFRAGEHHEASGLALELEHGYFVYRRAGLSRLGVIAGKSINLAVLEVAVNAATLKLGAAEASGPFQSYATLASNVGIPPMIAAPPLGSAPGVPPTFHQGAVPPRPPGVSVSPAPRSFAPAPSPAPSSSGVTIQWSPKELLHDGSRVRGTIGPAVMQHILSVLVRYVGAHAKAIIVEELARLNATPATVTPAIFTDVIHGIAARIPDPGVRNEFIDSALGDRK